MNATVLDLEPMTPVVGAIAGDIDLRVPLEADNVRTIRAGVLEHGVVFFRDQDLTPEQMLAFMSNFGTPCVDPFAAVEKPVPPEFTIVDMHTLPYRRATSLWHYDSSLAAEPASLIALRAVEVPARRAGRLVRPSSSGTPSVDGHPGAGAGGAARRASHRPVQHDPRGDRTGAKDRREPCSTSCTRTDRPPWRK